MHSSSIVELRQYTLHHGRRDELIELFEREFIEPQESLGMSVIGLFRDVDRPDRFVWLRGFTNMEQRAEALQGFYGGPVWKEHREAANATMIDSDNVLLLCPAGVDTAFAVNGKRPERSDEGLVVATIYYVRDEKSESFARFFEETLAPILSETGGAPIASYVTENAANNFPALPVREGENVFVSFSTFASPENYAAHLQALSESKSWITATDESASYFDSIETLRLAPTLRSKLHG